ncbi:hypothetical protein HN747_05105 [archaeon]|nr:hypothetical protein [archaeon]
MKDKRRAAKKDAKRTPEQKEFMAKLDVGRNEVIAKYRHKHGMGSAHNKIKPTHRIIDGKKVAVM